MSILSLVLRNIFSKPKESPKSDNAFVVTPFHEQELIAHTKIVHEAFPGPSYYEWLKWFHHFVKPNLYLEIGIETGKALAFANPPTLAIGIDPNYKISHHFKAATKLYKLPSNSFFSDVDLNEAFDHQKIDMAFIDGLHTFDQALMDFINVEKNAHRDTIVLFHDVIPVIPETANRERSTYFWVGDTWKVLIILKKYRPDLKLIAIPTLHSGLGVASRLDPSSNILFDNFDKIVAEAMGYQLSDYLPTLRTTINTLENDFEKVALALNS